MSTETPRNQLSKTVGLHIPPPRVRLQLDRLAMNRKREQELAPIRKRLLELKKQGAPSIPEKPDSKADETNRNAYKEAVKEYNQYTSAEFTRNVTIYELCKRLTKISALYDKQAALQSEDPPKDLSKKNKEELNKEIKAALDLPENREDESVTLGFAQYTNGRNLENPEDVSRLLQELRNENPQVDLFFQRDNISKGKIRFTDSAIIALAATLQRAVSEFAQHAMRTTIEVNKKIMYPDHCVSAGLENCSLYPLFCNLPTFKLVVNRQARREQWEVDFRTWKVTNARTKGKKAASRKSSKKSTDGSNKTTKTSVSEDKKVEFESFEQREVAAGYAVTHEREDQRGQKKIVYLWKGLDDLEEGDDEETVDNDTQVENEVVEVQSEEETRKFGFNFYIAQVCKELKETNTSDDNGDEYENVRVSTNIKRFFSNLLIELIHRLAPQIRLVMSIKDAKTVSYEMVTIVLRSILIDSYAPNANGDVELSESHLQLFADIEEKIRLYNEYMKEHKNKPNTEGDDADVVADVEVDVAEVNTEPEPEPVVESLTKNKTSSTKSTGKTASSKVTKSATPEPVVEPVPVSVSLPAANSKKGTPAKAPTRRTAPK